MRIKIALTLIVMLQVASLSYAQSDAPPPSRFIRRYEIEAPPPSGPIRSIERKSEAQLETIERVQFAEPVPAPPAELPGRALEMQSEQTTSLKKLAAPPILAPLLPKNPTLAKPVDQNETLTVESHTPPPAAPNLFKPTPAEKQVPVGQRGTWVPVRQESKKPIQTTVIEQTGSHPTPAPTTVQSELRDFPLAPPPPPEEPLSFIQAETHRPVPPTDPVVPVAPVDSPPWGINDYGLAPDTEENFVDQPFASPPTQFYNDPIYSGDCWYQGDEFQSGCDSIEYDQISPLVNLGLKGGNDRSLLNVQTLLPLWQNDIDFVFADIRGRFDDKESSQGEFGLGYRTFISPEWIFGIYGYYDLLKTNQRNRFNQFTTGFEFLSEDWDIRLNGYFPNEGGKPSKSASGISNGTIISNAYQERAATGFNTEVGKRIIHWGRYDSNELRWFVGYYHLENSAPGFKKMSGPSTRLEYRSYDLPWLGEQSRLTAGVEYTTDKVRDDQYWGFVNVQIPFSPKWSRKKLDPLRRRFVDSPVRDID
ncbi:inverse autotransporter beta domain-containing protein [Thalassoglobus sp.]|uniref:inverse autotransporter beta domain-containing protein n=1 Tax=Thalassoglobus sp. TaxID=2795869 RepID=UPI003AA86106